MLFLLWMNAPYFSGANFAADCVIHQIGQHLLGIFACAMRRADAARWVLLHDLTTTRPENRHFVTFRLSKRVHRQGRPSRHTPLDTPIGICGQGDDFMAQDVHHEAQRQTLRNQTRRPSRALGRLGRPGASRAAQHFTSSRRLRATSARIRPESPRTEKICQ
jgi:hypothetical protein